MDASAISQTSESDVKTRHMLMMKATLQLCAMSAKKWLTNIGPICGPITIRGVCDGMATDRDSAEGWGGVSGMAGQ
jgi:hypothetical protein